MLDPRIEMSVGHFMRRFHFQEMTMPEAFTVTKWRTDDGLEFDDQQAAEAHERAVEFRNYSGYFANLDVCDTFFEVLLRDYILTRRNPQTAPQPTEGIPF